MHKWEPDECDKHGELLHRLERSLMGWRVVCPVCEVERHQELKRQPTYTYKVTFVEATA